MVILNNSCTFADSIKKPTTMNSKLNTLIGRCNLLKLPPPLTDVNIIDSYTNKAATPALLHSVYSVRGRAFSCASLWSSFNLS